MHFGSRTGTQNERHLPFGSISASQACMTLELHILAVVGNLQSVKVNIHDPILWVFAALQAGGQQTIVYDLAGISQGKEHFCLIFVSMAVELPSD